MVPARSVGYGDGYDLSRAGRESEALVRNIQVPVRPEGHRGGKVQSGGDGGQRAVVLVAENLSLTGSWTARSGAHFEDIEAVSAVERKADHGGELDGESGDREAGGEWAADQYAGDSGGRR